MPSLVVMVVGVDDTLFHSALTLFGLFDGDQREDRQPFIFGVQI